MRRMLAIAALLLAACQEQVAPGSARDLVNQAVTAQGGDDALRGLTGLNVRGDARFGQP